MTSPSPPAPRARSRPAPAALALLAAAGLAACGRGDAVPSDDGDAASTAGGSAATASAEDGWRGVPVDPPLSMPRVTLTDTRGRPHSLREEAREGVTLLFLGYTHCPDVCPVQLANLGAVLDDLPPSVRRHLRVVFVSVDPARDSAARIRTWLDRFGEGFVGLRGGEEEIRALQDSLRLPRAVRQAREEDAGYDVGHAAQVLAFGPDGRARLAYPSGTRQRDWRDDLPRLVRRAVAGGEGAGPREGVTGADPAGPAGPVGRTVKDGG